jgi:L-2,4-diaminobutyrate decarboxylase
VPLFDTAKFRADGHALVDQLADHLTRVTNREGPVLPAGSPERNLAEFPPTFTEGPTTTLGALVARVLERSNQLHHPRFVGHQVATPLPEAALLELVSAVLNQGMAVYEMGPVSSAMERSVLSFLARTIGFPEGADGVLTSGGSLGNLTALMAAREASNGRGAGVILGSEEAHYSNGRAAKLLGLRKLVQVPADSHFRMRVDALEEEVRRVKTTGRRVVAVVASACTTSTGAFDPLTDIADVCRREGVWMHVDGAHGASFALSSKYRSLLAGAELADTIVWDAHKMLMLPALVTAVLFREGAKSFGTFSQKASYLFSAGDPRTRWFDYGQRTIECTKRMMSLELYGTLAIRGTRPIAEYLDSRVDLAKRFAEKLRAEPDFEVPVEPECNIVCFRHLRKGEDPNDVQSRVRSQILESGAFYLVETTLRGKAHLRMTLVHPETNDDDLDALIAAIRRAR